MAKKRRESKRKTPQEEPRPRLSFERILVYAIAFTLFMIPLFLWPGISEYGYGKTMVAVIAVSILTILWGLTAWQKRGWTLRVPWIAFPFLGLVVASLLSLLGAINGRVVVQSLVLVVVFFQLGFLIANVVREKRDVTLLLGAVLASAFLASGYGLLQYLGALPGAPNATGLDRIISTMGNRNFLGGFLSYLLLPSFVLLLRPRSKCVRAAALLLIAFNFGTLMLVNQMAPMVGLVAAVILLVVGLVLFRPIEPIRRNRAWLIALLVILAVTFLIEAPAGPLNSVVGLSRSETSWIGRIWERNSGRTRELDWWVGFEMLKARPLTGVGLGNYKLAFLPYKAAFLSTPRGEAYTDLRVSRAAQAHGDYVQVAAELGTLGLLALIGAVAALGISLWKRLRRNPDEPDRLDLLLYAAGLVVFLVHALVSFPAHLPTSMLMIVVLLGLIYAPAYGDSCVVTVRLSRRLGAIAFGVASVFAVVVSAFAISDLSANMLMYSGSQILRVGEASDAKRVLERSIAGDFAPRQTYYFLASAQMALGQNEAALDSLEKCFTRFVDENTYLVYADLATNLGHLEEARHAVDFLLSTRPKPEIEWKARYVQATIAVRLRDYGGAERLFQALAADAPSFELASIALGNLYQAQGRSAEARAAYTRALDLIDGKLSEAEASLAGRTQFTVDEYGALSHAVTTLRSERSFVLEQLAKLPAAE